jgi:hypothetical protein
MISFFNPERPGTLSSCPCLLSAEITGMHHHAWQECSFFKIIFLMFCFGDQSKITDLHPQPHRISSVEDNLEKFSCIIALMRIEKMRKIRRLSKSHVACYNVIHNAVLDNQKCKYIMY